MQQHATPSIPRTHWYFGVPQMTNEFLTESIGFHRNSLDSRGPWDSMNSYGNSLISGVARIPDTCQGVWWSDWKRRSAYGLDCPNDSNDTLESRYAPRNPRSCSGFRFAEVLLIQQGLDSGAWILESGGRQQMVAGNSTLLRGEMGGSCPPP